MSEQHAPDRAAARRVLPGPIVEDALRGYADDPRHAAIAVMNALRKAGLTVVRGAVTAASDGRSDERN